MNKTDTIRLNMLGLPVIRTMEDFSDITHISKYTLFQLSKNADKYYKTYNIPKKDGSSRTISQPSKKLKGLQSWILVNILNQLKVSSSCKGFEKGLSIYENARPHIGANSILTLDLKDFFPSITHKQIFSIYKAVGYNSLISVILANICTYSGELPQGGPCSPKLANLVSWKLDVRIQGYVGKRGVNYTRYADDLSFSGLNPLKVVQIIPMIKKIVEAENFLINPLKTRVSGLSKAKVVTGLTLYNDNIGVGKEKYKLIRAKIHELTSLKDPSNTKLLYELGGWLAYLNSVNKKRFNKAKKYISGLKAKHPDSLIHKLLVI